MLSFGIDKRIEGKYHGHSGSQRRRTQLRERCVRPVRIAQRIRLSHSESEDVALQCPCRLQSLVVLLFRHVSTWFVDSTRAWNGMRTIHL